MVFCWHSIIAIFIFLARSSANSEDSNQYTSIADLITDIRQHGPALDTIMNTSEPPNNWASILKEWKSALADGADIDKPEQENHRGYQVPYYGSNYYQPIIQPGGTTKPTTTTLSPVTTLTTFTVSTVTTTATATSAPTTLVCQSPPQCLQQAYQEPIKIEVSPNFVMSPSYYDYY